MEEYFQLHRSVVCLGQGHNQKDGHSRCGLQDHQTSQPPGGAEIFNYLSVNTFPVSRINFGCYFIHIVTKRPTPGADS